MNAKDSNPKDAIGDTKLPLWLLSPVAKAAWALAQFAGLTKYGAWNWRVAGVRTSVYLSAIERHLEAYKGGEELDPVDGTEHLGNVMACCSILLEAKAAGVLTDDRPPSIPFRETWERAQKQMAVLKEQYQDKNPRHYTIADTVVVTSTTEQKAQQQTRWNTAPTLEEIEANDPSRGYWKWQVKKDCERHSFALNVRINAYTCIFCGLKRT